VTSPVRVLELRSVRGTGGGPEKTILTGAARMDPARVRVTVAYVRDGRDPIFGIGERAADLGIDYVEIRERHSFDLSIWNPLRELVRARGIHVIHAHDYKTNLLALLLARPTGAAPMTTEHGWTGHSWRERRVYYPADKRMSRLFPRVVAVSEDIRQELIRCGASPARVTTLPNGIDAAAFRRNPSRVAAVRASIGMKPGDRVVGAVGRLEQQKRFDLLLIAFSHLLRSHPSLRLVIVGDGGEREHLERAAQGLGVRQACAFLGHRHDVADLHHAFDLFVQASDYEGTPNAVLEALAMETPVVATDAGGTAQILTDGVEGLIVPRGDVNALSAAMARVLADPGAASGRVRAGRHRVEGPLSFDGRLAALERIYALLAGGPAGEAPAVADPAGRAITFCGTPVEAPPQHQ
jgi:glycosyltransferase involved in cell wall biosynthesis